MDRECPLVMRQRDQIYIESSLGFKKSRDSGAASARKKFLVVGRFDWE